MRTRKRKAPGAVIAEELRRLHAMPEQPTPEVVPQLYTGAVAPGLLAEQVVPRRRARKAAAVQPSVETIEAYEAIDREREAGPAAPRVKRRHVRHDTWPLIQLTLVESADVAAQVVQGAIVKVTVELRPSEREGFDAAELRARLRNLGARAVVVAVTVLPEAPKKVDAVARAERPEQSVNAWFDALPPTVEEADREAARELAHRLVEDSKVNP
jgi:hypothetical protein